MATAFASMRGRLRIDDSLNVHYSQLGEDVVVRHLFQYARPLDGPGFYIDVGAHDPWKLSNTALLHLLGWRGVNIDANAGAIEAFRTERPDDVSIAAAVGPERGRTTFYVFGERAVSTTSPRCRDDWIAAGWTLEETRDVEVAPLRRLLEPHLRPGDRVDYLNIDIEGSDLVALQTYDFERFAPTVLSVEIHGLDLQSAAAHPTVAYLNARGYRMISHMIATSIFLREPR